MEKLILYHGTNSRHIKKIQQEGIIPRQQNKIGNWKNLPSRKGFVYLSIAYAGYYSFCSLKQKNDRPFLVEVALDKEDEKFLYPDEDFIGQVLNYRNKGSDLFEVTQGIDLEEYKEDWKTSLEKFGNVCYKGKIEKEKIIRIKEIPMSMQLDFLNPSITILNYFFLGQKYRDLIKFVMGDIKENPFVQEIKQFYSQLKNQE